MCKGGFGYSWQQSDEGRGKRGKIGATVGCKSMANSPTMPSSTSPPNWVRWSQTLSWSPPPLGSYQTIKENTQRFDSVHSSGSRVKVRAGRGIWGKVCLRRASIHLWEWTVWRTCTWLLASCRQTALAFQASQASCQSRIQTCRVAPIRLQHN